MAASDTMLLFDAGAGTAQGGRPEQEDRYIVILPDQFPYKSDDKMALFAVYDGHGTDMVSEHVRKHLPGLIVQQPEFYQGDYETAIAKAFQEEDKLLLELAKGEDTEPIIAGSTIALCLINLTKGILVVGDIGDSQILFAERTTSEDVARLEVLTKTHKPNMPAEQQRIERAGGAVHQAGGTARLGTLNMSRAIGDLQYKNPMNTFDVGGTAKSRRASSAAPDARGDFISNEAHIKTIQLDNDRRYVVMVSTDGVSDAADAGLLLDHVMKSFAAGSRAVDIASEITARTAAQAGSDNCTSVLVFLDGTKS